MKKLFVKFRALKRNPGAGGGRSPRAGTISLMVSKDAPLSLPKSGGGNYYEEQQNPDFD
jgi:hypothetical protein